jgi:hypothetical protein
MVTFTCTPQDMALINDIEEVGYGEIYDVKCPNDDRVGGKIEVTRHEAFKSLLKELRNVKQFDKIIVHGSLPAYGTYKGYTEGGRLCVKKFKFS